MTWVKIDDKLHGHPKVQRAWREDLASLGLHLLALSYAGAHDTDGHVPGWFVCGQIPGRQRRLKAIRALIDAGLWEALSDGYQIHDFLDYNASRAQMLEVRDASRARTRARPRAYARTPASRPVPDPFKGLRSHPSIEEASS